MNYSQVLEYAREMRRNQTEVEGLVWKEVRNRNFHGYKFSRQHIISYNLTGIKKYVIVDFFCHSKKLIVEIDGGYHSTQLDLDYARDKIMGDWGYKTVRFTNEEVMEDWDSVAGRLLMYLLQIY